MAGKILLIEEDVDTAHEVQASLLREGYNIERAQPGPHVIRQLVLADPDLVILGICDRDQDWQFCHRLLTFLDKPLMLLCGGEDQMNRARALEMGADDCLLKPFLRVEFVARVRALLRRDAAQALRPTPSFFVDGDLVVDLGRREVRCDGRSIVLTATEFRVLACLLRHAGELVTHERLALEVWGGRHPNPQGTLKVYVHQLREKLEPDPTHPQRIVTWRREGYMFKWLAERQQPALGWQP